MRIVIEISNGCIDCIAADETCEVLVIDHDEYAESTLPDGERGYASVWDVPGDAAVVTADFEAQGFRRP